MANNRESGNGTFINLFLMVSTLMFIHQGWQEIDIMTNDDPIGWKNQINCQRDALRWVTLSFLNYFFFYIVVLIFSSLTSTDEAI